MVEKRGPGRTTMEKNKPWWRRGDHTGQHGTRRNCDGELVSQEGPRWREGDGDGEGGTMMKTRGLGETTMENEEPQWSRAHRDGVGGTTMEKGLPDGTMTEQRGP